MVDVVHRLRQDLAELTLLEACQSFNSVTGSGILGGLGGAESMDQPRSRFKCMTLSRSCEWRLSAWVGEYKARLR
ncbi:MAG: hypothetical protein DWH74_00815 [Planctomycetota bacterium]|nr:MAG: hypothetical protein DWH74_00815 [Planctomycetota bacterium]